MTITIHNTTKIVTLNDVPARIWEGHTVTGIPVHCYITRIAVDKDEDASQFETELAEMQSPSDGVWCLPDGVRFPTQGTEGFTV